MSQNPEDICAQELQAPPSHTLRTSLVVHILIYNGRIWDFTPVFSCLLLTGCPKDGHIFTLLSTWNRLTDFLSPGADVSPYLLHIREVTAMGVDDEAEIDRLPVDLLAHTFALIASFVDLAQASRVCRKWKQGVEQSLARRKCLSFAGWNMDDDSIARLVGLAYNLKELDISRSSWSCRITDDGLFKISLAKCVSNLTSISLWGMTAITDKGVMPLVSRATSLEHLNIGGTFITDDSLYAIAHNCPHLKAIILWSCRHVTGSGLVTLVNKCSKLESINVWGMRVPVDCFVSLLSISPALEIKPGGMHLNVGRVSLWPVL